MSLTASTSGPGPLSPAPTAAPATLDGNEQLSHLIVFLEARQPPADVAAFCAAAMEASLAPSGDTADLLRVLERARELDLAQSSFSAATVLACLLARLRTVAPLVPSVHYDALLLLAAIPSAAPRRSALKAHLDTLELVVGDLLALLGRWSSGPQLDQLCSIFAPLVLRARDPTSPYVRGDTPLLPEVLRELVVAWCAEVPPKAP